MSGHMSTRATLFLCSPYTKIRKLTHMKIRKSTHMKIWKLTHMKIRKAKKEADGSPNLFAAGTVVNIMRSVDEEDLHLYFKYFKYFNHEATDGTQPTDSKEYGDKWGYIGCIEMIKKAGVPLLRGLIPKN